MRLSATFLMVALTALGACAPRTPDEALAAAGKTKTFAAAGQPAQIRDCLVPKLDNIVPSPLTPWAKYSSITRAEGQGWQVYAIDQGAVLYVVSIQPQNPGSTLIRMSPVSEVLWAQMDDFAAACGGSPT